MWQKTLQNYGKKKKMGAKKNKTFFYLGPAEDTLKGSKVKFRDETQLMDSSDFVN